MKCCWLFLIAFWWNDAEIRVRLATENGNNCHLHLNFLLLWVSKNLVENLKAAWVTFHTTMDVWKLSSILTQNISLTYLKKRIPENDFSENCPKSNSRIYIFFCLKRLFGYGFFPLFVDSSFSSLVTVLQSSPSLPLLPLPKSPTRPPIKKRGADGESISGLGKYGRAFTSTMLWHLAQESIIFFTKKKQAQIALISFGINTTQSWIIHEN